VSAFTPRPAATADFPPLYRPHDFSPADLAGIRQHASGLLESGFLLITESHYVEAVIERCDEMLGRPAR
jgi:hypothetical protein